jgi:beta-lactamase class C
VALWNSNTSQPGGLEFEVMDMLYGLPFRDWMELNTGTSPQTIAAVDSEHDTGSGDSAESRSKRKGRART